MKPREAIPACGHRLPRSLLAVEGWDRDGGAPGPASDSRGAVYVEFLIAFLPFFVFFLCLWQVSILYYVKLVVDHAAFSAARAGAVIVGENPNRVDPSGGASSVNQLTKSRDDYIRTAAEIALASLILDNTILSVDLKYPNPNQPLGDDAMRDQSYTPMTTTSVQLMRVRVETVMNCKIAFANAIMCPPNTVLGLFMKNGLKAFVLPVKSEAVFPYQGASYAYKSNDDQGGNGGKDAVVSDWGGLCFGAGTAVDTPDGPRPIEGIRVGDLVTSRDEASGEVRSERVVRTFVTPDQPVVDLALRESETIRVTPGHLFGTADRGWVGAYALDVGEALVTAAGGFAHVQGISEVDGRETVYNFEVEHTHTYFVGRSETWVHNPNGAGQGCLAPIPGFGSGNPASSTGANP